MSPLQIIILGIVQGITEFLPISSDGHLVLTAALFQAAGAELHELLDVEIVLHAGTLMTILFYFWPQIRQMLTQDWRVVGLIVVGTIPAVIIGLSAKEFASHWLENPLLAALLLPVNGVVLLLAAARRPGDAEYSNLAYGGAILIGIAQAMAILPGISRSGSTIAMGLALGLRREAAANFSFLLGIPAISGACTLTAIKLVRRSGETSMGGTDLGWLLVGALVSFAVGLVALRWLIAWLRQGRLQWFAWWCIVVGLLMAVWQIALAANQG